MITRRSSLAWFAVIVAFVTIVVLVYVSPVQGQVGIERRIVLRQDLAIPGYEVLLMEVTLAVGGREGRHSHPGELIGRLIEGELTIEQEGLPTKTYRPGESAVVDAGRVHEGINTGKTAVKVFAVLVVPKGKPLTTPVSEVSAAPATTVPQR